MITQLKLQSSENTQFDINSNILNQQLKKPKKAKLILERQEIEGM